MKRGKITITSSTIHIELNQDGQVWLSRWQLADLFGVYIQTITTNIKAIIKSGAVKPSIDCTVMMSGNTLLLELYGMDMIIALAFRINSSAADIFNKWVIRKILSNSRSIQPNIFIGCGGAGNPN